MELEKVSLLKEHDSELTIALHSAGALVSHFSTARLTCIEGVVAHTFGSLVTLVETGLAKVPICSTEAWYFQNCGCGRMRFVLENCSLSAYRSTQWIRPALCLWLVRSHIRTLVP